MTFRSLVEAKILQFSQKGGFPSIRPKREMPPEPPKAYYVGGPPYEDLNCASCTRSFQRELQQGLHPGNGTPGGRSCQIDRNGVCVSEYPRDGHYGAIPVWGPGFRGGATSPPLLHRPGGYDWDLGKCFECKKDL